WLFQLVRLDGFERTQPARGLTGLAGGVPPNRRHRKSRQSRKWVVPPRLGEVGERKRLPSRRRACQRSTAQQPRTSRPRVRRAEGDDAQRGEPPWYTRNCRYECW